MEDPLRPEEDLNHVLNKQQRDIHGNLFQINQLFMLCCDESLPLDQIHEKCKPVLERLKHDNPLVAYEIEELMCSGDRQKLMSYFEQEKQQLIQILNDEMKHGQDISKRVNHQRNDG